MLDQTMRVPAEHELADASDFFFVQIHDDEHRFEMQLPVELLVLHGVAPVCDHFLDVGGDLLGPGDAVQRNGGDVGVGGHELHVQRHQRRRCGLEVRVGWLALPLLAAADAADDMQIEAEPFAGVALGGG